jgi:hypothetical protein
MPLALALLLFAAPLHTRRVPVALADGEAVLRVPTLAPGEFVRLETEGAAPSAVRLNDSEIPRTPGKPEWDLTGIFHPGAANRLRVEGHPGRLTLVCGPRVYIASQTVSPAGITVAVRNTLDNTANVDVEVELTAPGASRRAAASLTVPPGATLPSDFPISPSSPDWRLKTTITKQAEAVEGEYAVEEILTPK